MRRNNMQQYTTEWAKEVIKLFDNVIKIQQKEIIVIDKYWKRKPKNSYQVFLYFKNGESIIVGDMLEHPDGWEKSLVTREML